MQLSDLTPVVEAWIAADPDSTTREELINLLQAATAGTTDALTELQDRFAGNLEFGTAGLRGALGGGPNRMNRAVVIRAAAGIGAFLHEFLSQAGADPYARIVIGYDARHRSDQFALDTAAVLTSAGHTALLLPSPLPTPVLAYTVKAIGADAGIMVTASHNPANDNGYKVYLGGRIVQDSGQGAQIVPPFDQQISHHIDAVGAAKDVPRAVMGWQTLDHSTVDAYISAISTVVAPLSSDNQARRADTKIVLTPMHGVGGETTRTAFKNVGFTDLHAVSAQWDPNPNFPTVSFPNPEEPGAMDLALELAAYIYPDVVIATDPDADRCAVATVIEGKWTTLHGDVVGALLGEYVAAQNTGDGVMANSIVSSRRLTAIAQAHGLNHQNTLTGFKWISRVPSLIYGYEEALGYCIAPHLVADKDGISTAVKVAELVSELKANGHTLEDAINDLHYKYGVYESAQISLRFADLTELQATLHHFLRNPPTDLAASPVVEHADLSSGYAGLPPTTGILLSSADNTRVIVRPSGTEPKIKAYLEVIVPLAPGSEASSAALTAGKESAQARLAAVSNQIAAALQLP